MPKTAYLPEWKKIAATYNSAASSLADSLGTSPDLLELKADFSGLLSKIDGARNFRSRLAAIEAYRKSKQHAELSRNMATVEAQIALGVASGKSSPEGAEAPARLLKTFAVLDKKIRSGERKLIKASQVEQEVANVRLLPPDALGGLRHVDVAALTAFLVTVKIKLPQEVLDDLAVGVEGVSLASMQQAAEDAVEPYRAKALAEVTAADSQALDWKAVQASTQALLERYTNEAAVAAQEEV
ncbi:MAG TPA: hypothetical protein PKY30_15655, partial [Myxococcota bacterium]|nr:hypothetical protein [Myxococcota bacterium]